MRFCLHYARINRAISQFLDGWNHHLSSMGNLSPVQLWIAGLSQASAAEGVSEVGKVIYNYCLQILTCHI